LNCLKGLEDLVRDPRTWEAMASASEEEREQLRRHAAALDDLAEKLKARDDQDGGKARGGH
jgi:hypothetical protein